MATTVSYSASMRTRKTNSASNAKSSAACQEYYENTYNYVGIVHFAGMALSGKVITGISLRIVAAQAGYGTGHTKTVYVRKSKPSLIPALDRLFESIPFEMVHTPQILPKHGWFTIRDKDDEKVLYSAISADVDILITGDKDFSAVEVEKPEILTPSQFNEKYLSM